MEYLSKLISKSKPKKEEVIEEVVDDEFSEALELYNEGDFSSSKDVLNNILAKNNKDTDALALMGEILFKQEQNDIALIFTKKALSIDRANKKACELENLLTSNKKGDIELTSLDDIDTLYEEAYDLYNQGDLASASDILENLLNFDDKHSEALALMGLIYYQSGMFEKAIEYYKKALKINKHGEMVEELKMRLS